MDPNNPVTHFCYANLLVDTPELPKALTHYRRALELNENFLEAHTHLGLALIGQSAFAEALKHLERAHKLMTPNGHPQRDRVARFILSCKRQQDFDKKLKLLISGDLVPQTWEDQLDAARVASRHKAHATAVRLYSAALAQHKSAFNDGTRWAAACSAVLAGCGETTEPLESRERDNLRGQALRWLRDELELAKTMVEDAENVDALIPVAERLKSWQGDPRLVGVRDEQRLTRFSQAERNAWNTFWAEVNQLLLSAKRKRLNAKT